jgi:hypothetical protein
MGCAVSKPALPETARGKIARKASAAMIQTKGTVRVIPDDSAQHKSARQLKRGESKIVVQGSTGEAATFAVKGNLTVGQLKTEIARETGLAKYQQNLAVQLTHTDSFQLGDNTMTLAECSVDDGATMILSNNGKIQRKVSFG